MVERLVECEELLQAQVRALLAFEVVPQLADDGRIESRGQVVQGGELHGLPQELGVRDLRRVHAGDERPDLREDLHQAFLGQKDQALPHRSRVPGLRGRTVLVNGAGPSAPSWWPPHGTAERARSSPRT